MDESYLKEQLEKLQLSASSVWEQKDKVRRDIYRTLATAYMNWREASQMPDWLEKQYANAGITTRVKRNNEVNFRPYIRLIFGFITPTQYEKNKINDYDLVMVQLDRQFNENPNAYQSNAILKLASYIAQCNGVSGIKADNAGEVQPDANDEVSDKEEKRLAKKKQSDDELASRSIDVLANSTHSGIGTADVHQHVRTDENNLVVLMGRREASGSITVLGTTNNAEAIRVAAIHTAQRNLTLIPYNIRLLAEVISTQMYPRIGKPKGKDAQRAWYKRILLDKTGVKLSNVHKLKRSDVDLTNDETTNPRFLMLRKVWEDVLFSSLRSQRSVVTLCKPRIFIGDKHRNIYLKTNERYAIETYIENGEIELMSAHPASSLKRVHDEKYIYMMTIENKFNNSKKNLHFYEHGRERDNPQLKSQTEFHFFAFKPKWKCAVDVGWLDNLRADWLDNWFVTLGRDKQLKRENNATFQLQICKTAIRFTYNMDDTGIAPTHNADVDVEFLDKAKEHKITARSKDLAPVLFNIAELPIDGTINVSGDDDAIVFEFTTDVGDYQIAVPTFDEKLAKSRVQRGLFYPTRAAE